MRQCSLCGVDYEGGPVLCQKCEASLMEPLLGTHMPLSPDRMDELRENIGKIAEILSAYEAEVTAHVNSVLGISPDDIN